MKNISHQETSTQRFQLTHQKQFLRADEFGGGGNLYEHARADQSRLDNHAMRAVAIQIIRFKGNDYQNFPESLRWAFHLFSFSLVPDSVL